MKNTVTQNELDFLQTNLVPSSNWRIWIAQHTGANLRDYRYRYTAMQVFSEPPARQGPEYCNTHVTTIVVGKLYAHMLFSSDWPDFPGYVGPLTQVWPPTNYYSDTLLMPSLSDREGALLHEAISRSGNKAHGSSQ